MELVEVVLGVRTDGVPEEGGGLWGTCAEGVGAAKGRVAALWGSFWGGAGGGVGMGAGAGEGGAAHVVAGDAAGGLVHFVQGFAAAA